MINTVNNILKNIENGGGFSILCSLARSFDENHKKQNSIHLISSIVLLKSNLDLSYLDERFSLSTWKINEKVFLFIVLDRKYFIDNNLDVYNPLILDRNKIVFIFITLEGLLGISNSKENTFEILFGCKSLFQKDFDLIGKNCFFLFLNITWWNILLFFKYRGIYISGGTTPKRHLLSTTDATLKNLLDIWFNFDVKLINKVIYESFNDNNKYLSSTIPYSIKSEIESEFKDFNNIFLQTYNVKASILLSDEYSNLRNGQGNGIMEELLFFLFRNILYSIELITKLILKEYTDKIDNLKTTLSKLKSEISSEKYQLTKIDDLLNGNTVHMSNKEKKEFKKERRKIIFNHENLIQKINLKIEKLSKDYSKLEEIIFNKENEIKDLEISLKDKSLNELNEIYFKSNISTKSKFSAFKKNNKKNTYLINNNVGERRYFSTNEKALKLHNLNINNSPGSFSINNSSGLNHIIEEITTNPMYVKISQILNSTESSFEGETPNNKYKQLQIEETLRFFWNQELNKIFNGKKSLFSNSIGIDILMNSISKLDKVLNTIKTDKRYLKNKNYRNHILLSENGLIISIVLSNVIPHIMKYKASQNTATLFNRIGKELHSNLLNNEWIKYDKNEKATLTVEKYYVEQNNNKYEIEKGLSKEEFYIRLDEILGIISSDDYFKLGCDLAEIVSENSNLFNFMNVANEDNTVQRIIVPGHKLEDQIVKLLAVDTEKLVMICEPCKWEITINDTKSFNINKYGGFLLNNINKNEFLNQSFINNGKTTLHDLKIIDCINYLGSIPYTINTQVLKHVLNLIKSIEGEEQLYNNNKIKELIKLNMHHNTKNLYNLTLRKKYGDISLIHKHNSQYYSDKSIITSALLFSSWCDSSKDNSIYFNYFIDWRGRLYTDTSYLSFQGGNLARSLLLFKRGQLITEKGLEHLKIYTANCFGLDKLSYNQRLEWTENNLEKIISLPNLSDDDFKSMIHNHKPIYSEFYNFMMEADEPLLFLSCCVELKNYYSDPNRFLSNLPVYLDATCSGLQHLSTMINDTNLAKYVNIVKSNKEDIPNDVYTHMVLFVNKKIQEYIKVDYSLAILENININRKFIKPGIMTISYGATTRGIAEQLKNNHFRQIDLVKGKSLTYELISKEFNKTDFDIHLTVKQIYVLAKAIHSVLYDVFPNLTILVKYLKDMNKLLKKLKLPTIWLTPAGLIIEQNYAPIKSRDLTTSILGKRRGITLREMDRNVTDIRKQNNSIVPNVVHSFDASNIALLVENISSNFSVNKMNLLTIHDCFATNANDVDEMVLKVKLAFIALYSEKSFIDSYHNFILEFINKTGFIIKEKSTSKGENISYVYTENANIQIPKVPSFTINKNLKFDILGSQYFIN